MTTMTMMTKPNVSTAPRGPISIDRTGPGNPAGLVSAFSSGIANSATWCTTRLSPAIDDVVAVVAVELVVARFAIDCVIAVATRDVVVAAATPQRIVAAQPEDACRRHSFPE